VIAQDLSVVLAYDLPHGIKDLADEHLMRWGISAEEAFTIACDNLRRWSTKPSRSPAPGVFVSPWQDNYDSSRLLLTELIRGLQVKGQHVAMVPDRDTLIVTGSEDEAGLEVMHQVAADIYGEPHSITALAFRLQGNEWEAFQPESYYPALDRFHSLRLDGLGGDYKRQQLALESQRTERDQDLYIGDYWLINGFDDLPAHSSSMWPEGVPALLPVTEWVGLLRQHPTQGYQLAAYARWERVREVVGDLMTPLDTYPQRFRVDRFPTEKQLNAIGMAEGVQWSPGVVNRNRFDALEGGVLTVPPEPFGLLPSLSRVLLLTATEDPDDEPEEAMTHAENRKRDDYISFELPLDFSTLPGGKATAGAYLAKRRSQADRKKARAQKKKARVQKKRSSR
jgi:hypothetical protein